MSSIYLDMDRPTLDAAYNNAAAVGNSGELMDNFNQRSAAWRQAHGAHLDVRYGAAPRNRIDYFPAPKPGILLIFIHGGYWQMRAKENFSFLAAGPLAHGVHVAMIGYTLAPDISLTGIVDEVRASIGWLKEHAADLGGNPDCMIVSGWSAGGHLAALCLDEPGVMGGLAISGIYYLEPMRLSSLNDKLRLTVAEQGALSPLHQPLSQNPLVVAYGTGELPELRRQSEQFAAARRNLPGKLLPLSQHNHFTILNALADPDGALTREVCVLADV